MTTERCDQHYVRFDNSTPAQKVVCHESGHAVGLTHGSDADSGYYPDGSVDDADDSLACLQTPVSVFQTAKIGPHNTSEVNGTY